MSIKLWNYLVSKCTPTAKLIQMYGEELELPDKVQALELIKNRKSEENYPLLFYLQSYLDIPNKGFLSRFLPSINIKFNLKHIDDLIACNMFKLSGICKTFTGSNFEMLPQELITMIAGKLNFSDIIHTTPDIDLNLEHLTLEENMNNLTVLGAGE